jgi:chromate reductase, NAD(P)H dehydrogenase (quinone)
VNTSTFQVAILVGSLRRESLNRRLARALARLAPPSLVFYDVALDELPIYNGDLETNRPESINRFVAQCARADAVLIVTPEYNRSLPPVLKNAIDWASKPMEKNVWRDKPVATSGITPGAMRTTAAQLHLRQVLGAVGAHVLGGEAYLTFQDGLIDSAGAIQDEATSEFLSSSMARFANFVAKLAG